MFDVAIVGCGVVGSAIAYQLAQYDVKVVILEAENDVAVGTTKANSGIVHAGYDPEPGTLMAKLNIEGAAMIRDLAKKLDIPYKQTGSLVVAFNDADLAMLDKLMQRGNVNGVHGLMILNSEQLHELEPEISDKAIAALYAPEAGVISPWELALAMAEVAVINGVQLRLNSKVNDISRTGELYTLHTASGDYQARFVVNAAGIQSAQVHNMVAKPAFNIHGNRGEYYLLDKQEGSKVRHVVFQCPSKVGKGVLVSPTAHGNLIVGPNATDVHGNDTATTVSGLELVATLAQKSVPTINIRANIRNFAGVRALSEADDFIISYAAGADNFIDVAGIKSPGLTAAPAIGKMVAGMLADGGLNMQLKADFKDGRQVIRFHNLSTTEKIKLIEREPAYGRIICRCENITEGEILAALHSAISPVSIDGVKRRTNAGMGRCQGGFCGPRVLEIISRELGIDPCDVLQDAAGTNILTCETKKRGSAHV